MLYNLQECTPWNTMSKHRYEQLLETSASFCFVEASMEQWRMWPGNCVPQPLLSKKPLRMSRWKLGTRFFLSDLIWTHKWPFKGLSDLHLGDQRVTLKKLVRPEAMRLKKKNHAMWWSSSWSFIIHHCHVHHHYHQRRHGSLKMWTSKHNPQFLQNPCFTEHVWSQFLYIPTSSHSGPSHFAIPRRFSTFSPKV